MEMLCYQPRGAATMGEAQSMSNRKALVQLVVGTGVAQSELRRKHDGSSAVDGEAVVDLEQVEACVDTDERIEDRNSKVLSCRRGARSASASSDGRRAGHGRRPVRRVLGWSVWTPLDEKRADSRR